MQRDWNRIFPTGDHRWTMGLRPTSVGEFFAPTGDREAVLAERRRLLAEDVSRYAGALPGAEGAIEEACDLLASLRSPIAAGQEGELAGRLTEEQPAERRLRALGGTLEPDLVWLEGDAGGGHRVIAGVVCFPSSWALTEKLGKPIRLVHEPVPHLNGQLGRQIDTFLAKLEPGSAWARENWSLAGDGRLNQHPSQPRTTLSARPAAEQVWVRLEHQLLLKLPRSGSVLFGIHVDPVPLATVLEVPAIGARLAQLLRTMADESLAYKRLAESRDRIVEMLFEAGSGRKHQSASDESGGAM